MDTKRVLVHLHHWLASAMPTCKIEQAVDERNVTPSQCAALRKLTRCRSAVKWSLAMPPSLSREAMRSISNGSPRRRQGTKVGNSGLNSCVEIGQRTTMTLTTCYGASASACRGNWIGSGVRAFTHLRMIAGIHTSQGHRPGPARAATYRADHSL